MTSRWHSNPSGGWPLDYQAPHDEGRDPTALLAPCVERDLNRSPEMFDLANVSVVEGRKLIDSCDGTRERAERHQVALVGVRRIFDRTALRVLPPVHREEAHRESVQRSRVQR